MLAGAQNHPIDGVFVEPKQACSGSHTDTLGRVVNDLPDCIGWQMQSEQRTGVRGRKAFATGAAIQQVAVLVLAVFAANTDVAIPTQAVVFALLVGAKILLKIAHGLPPALKELYRSKGT